MQNVIQIAEGGSFNLSNLKKKILEDRVNYEIRCVVCTIRFKGARSFTKMLRIFP